MQQFTVPQFIDVEDKIIGPITTRQFVIMLAGFLVMAIFYAIFDFSLFATASLLVFAITGTFSFAKINGRPFHFFVLNVIQTLKRPRLRVWININDVNFSPLNEKEKDTFDQNINIKKKKTPSLSRLNELSLIVDTKGTYKGEDKDDKKEINAIKNVQK
jgi:hypothetical protein